MSTMTKTEESIWMETPPVQALDMEMPEWYSNFQKASWERFTSLPLATRNDENWRYADLKKSRFETLSTNQLSGSDDSLIKSAAAGRFDKTAAHFVYENGQLVDSNIDSLPDGVICAPINNAIVEGGDRIKPFFDVDAKRLGDEKFAALNGAATNYGVFVFVPKGIEIEDPIVVQHFVSGENAPVFPRTLVIAEGNSKVSVVEDFQSQDEAEAGLSIGVCDLHAADGANLQHVLVQNLNDSSKQIHLSTSNAGKDSCVQSIVLNLGGAWVRNESINYMTANGADTQIYGANLANELQEFDQRTLQIHDAQHTTSDLLIKNALYDKSRVIFGGLIQVLPNAHHTDSYQTCRNLIGSEQAEINAMPGLEIDADQVRCSHGATSGQISEDEIFYLRSRGIPEEDARRIVSCGFLNEAFGKVGNTEIVDWLTGLIEDKFATV